MWHRSFTIGWCLCVQFLHISFMNRRHISSLSLVFGVGSYRGGSRLALSFERIQTLDLFTNAILFVWRVSQLLFQGVAAPEFIWFLFIHEGDMIHAFHSFMAVHVYMPRGSVYWHLYTERSPDVGVMQAYKKIADHRALSFFHKLIFLDFTSRVHCVMTNNVCPFWAFNSLFEVY
jgi:hypothetical protein